MQMNTLDNTLAERAKTHGDFSQVAAASQALKSEIRRRVMKSEAGATEMMCEAMDNIAQKLARIISGNPHEPDHWRDIAGYAMLVANQLETRK